MENESVTPRRRRLRRLVAGILLVLVGLAAVGAVPASMLVRGWWRQSILVADAHVRHQISHPGWSFPSRVVSEPVALTEPAWKLVAEARARGYQEGCPTPGPGQLCEKTGRVVPRSGDHLDPVLLGWLIGPDGEVREHLPLADAPKHLIDAIIAAEDRDFRSHRGVNLTALLRAALANARERSWSQGGSTLTMQVVRAFAGRREKTLARKAREAVMAMAIDSHLGKDGVLQTYLDAPYLGQRGGLSICGFQAAARHYFGKDARDLSLAEAATLAAILPAPARFAPDRAPEAARKRRDRVLRAMAETMGYDVSASLKEPLVTVPATDLPERHPAFLSATRAWLEGHLPAQELYGAGLTITAGIDLPAQAETERLFAAKTVLYEGLLGRRSAAPLQSAAVLLDVETGRIRAVWGGSDATSVSFNRATQARRQPGSAFKPVVYALALGQPLDKDGRPRFTAASTEPNLHRVFKTAQGDWSPRNVTGEYTPTASLAFGLALSQNVATASLLQDLGGPVPLIDFAQKLGFDTRRFPAEPGLALGQGEVTPLEMAQLAATVANGGRRITGVPILEIVDAAGTRRLGPPAAGEPVLTPQAAALTRELMRLVVDFGTGGPVRGAGDQPGYKGQVMGKTGTTDLERDVWFIGSTPRWAGVVWLGYDQPQPLGGSASDLAAPLWGWWLGRLTQQEAPLPTFPDLPKLTHRWICQVSGKNPGPGCQGIYAPFLPGTEPKATCEEDHTLPEPLPGEVRRPKYEGLWQRLAREKAEREQQVPPAPSAPVPGGEDAAP
ncbi:MAG: transglycosylase domain-containing protein [Deltaproteobacteria bacterium]|nr:transglycosylase domain-containing protein [Deltaproteobacteria bacterium]